MLFHSQTTQSLSILTLSCSLQWALSLDSNASRFSTLEQRAREVYIRTLWNGQYLEYDSSTSGHHNSIMADMMAGESIGSLLLLSLPSISHPSSFPTTPLHSPLHILSHPTILPSLIYVLPSSALPHSEHFCPRLILP